MDDVRPEQAEAAEAAAGTGVSSGAAGAQIEVEQPTDPGLIPLLKVLRKPGDEVQLTTAIAAIASTDRQFASDLLRAVLEEAPKRAEAARLLEQLPEDLDCEAERPLPEMIDGWRGRIDLEFTGDDGFHVLVEAKIYALYSPGQLQGYLDTSKCQGLVGLVRNRTFEEAEPEDERWVGSVRWADVLEKWMLLEHADPVVTTAWRQLLEVAKEQGDFGLMEFNQGDVLAWNRYKQGRETLLALLNDIYIDVRDMIRREWEAAYGDSLGDPASADTIGSRRTREWTTQLFMRFDLPNAPGAGRFQVQFAGGREELVFTAEGRWGGDEQVLTEQQKADPGLVRISDLLRDRGFDEQGAYYGDYWTRPHPASAWLKDTPANTRAELIKLAQADFKDLLESGLFEALPSDDVPGQ